MEKLEPRRWNKEVAGEGGDSEGTEHVSGKRGKHAMAFSSAFSLESPDAK